MDIHFTYLHGRLTVRQPILLPIHDQTPPPQDLGFGYPCYPRGSAHLSAEHAVLRRLVESETIEEHDGTVQVGQRFGSDETVVVVGGREFSLRKGIAVHQGFGMGRKGDQGASVWWRDSSRVFTLWLRDINIQKMLHLQSYMCSAKSRSSDPFERPGNPIMRQRPLLGYRNSLCLLDDKTGEVVSVLREKLPLATAPTAPAQPPMSVEIPPSPQTPDKHAKDSPGGKLAHKVDAIIHGIHPRYNDSEVDLESPDWSGDTPTDLHLSLEHDSQALAFITEATPTKSQSRGALESSVLVIEPSMLHPRNESIATFTTLATYRTGREDSIYQTADEQGLTRPSSFASTVLPDQHIRPLSEVSTDTARPPVRESSDDVLLEFLGREGTIRMSRIKQSGSRRASLSKEALQRVGTEEASSFWTYLFSPVTLWQSIPSLASWFSISTFMREAESSIHIDDKKRAADSAQRLSVIYVDEFGHGRKVWMRR